jgi:N-acetylglucosaminyl-diphospho-decaprenol L-rhamnosyltransferase
MTQVQTESYQIEPPPWGADAPACAVLLLSYHAAPYLPRCLASLRAQTYRDFEVILVDNASQDDTLAVARANAEGLPRLRLVPLQENLGFAGGNNVGLEHVAPETPFVVLLNTDAFPEPEWLARLVAAAQQDEQVALAVGKILSADPPHCIDTCGDTRNRFGVPRSRGRGQPAEAFAQSEDVFGGCGASLLVRKAVLPEIGGLFDESLYLYGEDIDLAYRVHARGYRCRYVADAVVYHLGSAASRGRDAWRHGLSRRNMWVVFMRYHRGRPLSQLLFLLYWLGGDVKLLLTGRAAVVWNQYRMLLFGRGIRS